jgi:peptidyl-dipeptidase A
LSCNIQSYVVADVFAAQLKHAVDDQVLNKKNISIQNNKAVGKYLIDKLYQYGDLYPWEELVEKATGEPLNSAYFVNELVGNDRENQE